MEKVRFEAFNVEELRVLRRACYEAGAAFGDPGHTAAERETLDDLAVEILGELKKKEAAAARQKQEEPLEKTVAKAVEDSLKDVVGKLPFAPKVFQSPAPPKERVVQRPDIPAKPKPGHEGFRLLDGPAPDFRRMTVEEFETLPAGVWMDVKKALPPLEHPVLTVDAYGNYHTRTEYTDTPEVPFCITYNDGRFWPPIAWSKFEPLKQGGD